ncbi:MAG: endo-1,4-beta-xylanase [Ruminococcus sp.]|nr:endo-1,4-beta-xylanase [Ruminococcus sp.]
MICSSAPVVYAEDSTATAPEGKIIYSSDFEDGDVSLFSKRNDSDTTVVSASTDNAVSGTKSLCASGRTKSWNGPALKLDDICEPGTAYLVSAKVMGQYYTSNTMSLQYTDASGTEHYENLANLNGNGWQEVNDIKISFSADVSNVMIYFEGGTDNIYIDDFVLKEAPKYSIQEDIPSLKDVYSDYFKIGGVATVKELAPQSTKDLILKHCNSFTAGNEMKPDALLDQNACIAMAKDGDDTNPQVTLDQARSLLDFARDNNIPMRGHVLVWHQQTPTWFFKENYDVNGDWVSKEKMLKRLENYIKNVFETLEKEYPEIDFYAYDVVNECWLDDGSQRQAGTQEEASKNSPWVKVFGDNMSFIKPAFEFAKKYAPEGTKLYYNDFNEYMPQKTDAIIKMVEEINSDGHYIDGIGMQSHLDARSGSDAFPSVNVYKKALDKFCETGLDVQVTELDVTVNDKDHFKEQAQYYSDIMDTIVAQKDHISSVTFWGTTDDMSWRASGYPLLFNEDYTAKESFYAIIDGIESTGTTTTTTKPSETTTTTTTNTTTTTPNANIPNPSLGIPVKEDITPDNFNTGFHVGDKGIIPFNSGNSVWEIMDVKVDGDAISITNSDRQSDIKFTCKKEGTVTVKVTVSSSKYNYLPRVLETTIKVNPAEEKGDTMYGDANEDGEVTLADAVLIMQSLANPDIYTLTEKGRLNADVVGNGDGISSNDALAIQMTGISLLKLEDLPLEEIPKFE